MSQTADLKQKVWAEIENLPPDELERMYRLILLVKDEFIDVTGEERYLSAGWRQVEQEASDGYQRGGLRVYDNVDAMMDDILADSSE
jgi:hypothetical protein